MGIQRTAFIQTWSQLTRTQQHYKKKGKAVPSHCRVLSILDPDDRTGWVFSATPWPLSPGETRYPLLRRPGGPQSRSGQSEKYRLPLGLEPRTVQPVASLFTDHAILATTRTVGTTETCMRFLPPPHPTYMTTPPQSHSYTNSNYTRCTAGMSQSLQ